MRGKGTTCLSTIGKSKMTFTGSVTLEQGADLCFGGTGFPKSASRISMGDATRLVVKTTVGSLSDKTELAVNGSASLYVSGGNGEPALTVNGNVTGEGTISLTDQGGVQFNGTNNTFKGEVKSTNTGAGIDQKIGIGNGARFSWGDAKITVKRVEERLVLNTDSNVTFAAVVGGKGRIQKKGLGTLTLAQPLDRAAAAAANVPVFEIDGGTVALGAEPAEELAGLMKLARDAVFDACGRASTVCLPSGRGTVANTGGTSLCLKGGWTNDVVFSGTLTCPCDVTIQGDGAWHVAETTVVTNDLTVSSGHLVANSLFVTTNAVTLGDEARLDFSADDYLRLSRLTGLRLDFWNTSTEFSRIGSNHHAEVLEAYLEKIRTAAPMYSTDMKLFERLQNGDNKNGTNKDCPFAKVLGAYDSAYVTDPNLFAALFHGFLHVTTPGAYTFRMRADDDGCVWLNGERLIKICYGNSGNVSSEVTRELSAGDHPFAVMFGEETGYDVMMVEIKGSDVPEWQCVPLSMLKPVSDNGIRIGALKGTGTIGLAENGQWPSEMPTERFTGRVIVDASAKSASSGALALSSARMQFVSGWDVDTANWTLAGRAVCDESLGVGAVRLTPGAASAEGGVNTSVPVPVTGPWSVEFDFQAVEPWHASVGDGFVVCLQSNGPKQCCGGRFNYNDGSMRVNCPTAYGVQHYLSTYLNFNVWMKGGNAYPAAGGFATNTTDFTMRDLQRQPLHVRFAYDGSANMTYAFSFGTKSVVRTNSCAAADLAALFPNGAHVGIWAGNGDYYTSAFIKNVVLDIPGTTDSVAPEFGGELRLGTGTVTAVSGSVSTGCVSGPLAVFGAANVSGDDMALAFSSPT